MQTKNTNFATPGIANGHWEPTTHRSNLLALAREGISKLFRTHESTQPSTEVPRREDQLPTHH